MQSARVQKRRASAREIWPLTLGLFVVAGATGALFRFGVVYDWTMVLDLGDIRHAHSHLMYFGWGTPALMALIWALLPDEVTAPRQRLFRGVVGATLAAAVLAYPLFLLFGYAPVEVGGARLPIAVVGASLNIFGWYGFVGLYVAATRTLQRTTALRLWDWAVLALLLSTMGTWGLSVIHPLGLHDPLLSKALTHVFLDLFSEGWFVLGVVGIFFAVVEPEATDHSEWPVWWVGLGLPFTFILALPQSSVSTTVELAGRAGSALVAVCLILFTARLVRSLSSGARLGLWGVPLACLALKAGAQLAGSVAPTLWLGGNHALRILYLHLMLLGFVSLGLVAAARTVWRGARDRDVVLFYGAVITVLVSLALLWPQGGGVLPIAHTLAAWAAVLPVLTGLGLLRRTWIGDRDAWARASPHTPTSVE